MQQTLIKKVEPTKIEKKVTCEIKNSISRSFTYIFWILILAIAIFFFIRTATTISDGISLYKITVDEKSISSKVEELTSDKDFVSLSKISGYFLSAIVSVEDHRFFYHHGIDFIATTRALITNFINGKTISGGSTITQQLAKNMYFSFDKKYSRKIAELIVALRLEQEYSKEQILELYCNIIYFGNGYYGIRQAANGYFNVPPDQLTLEQAVILAGIPKAPSIYNIKSMDERTMERTKIVLYSMIKNGYISYENALKLNFLSTE